MQSSVEEFDELTRIPLLDDMWCPVRHNIASKHNIA